MKTKSKIKTFIFLIFNKDFFPQWKIRSLFKVSDGMLKLKLQYFGHLMPRPDSFEKTLMLGKIEGRRRMDNRGWDGWMASLTQWTWVWVGSGSWCWPGRPGMLQLMGSQRVRHDWETELNWWDTYTHPYMCVCIYMWLFFPNCDYKNRIIWDIPL